MGAHLWFVRGDFFNGDAHELSAYSVHGACFVVDGRHGVYVAPGDETPVDGFFACSQRLGRVLPPEGVSSEVLHGVRLPEHGRVRSSHGHGVERDDLVLLVERFDPVCESSYAKDAEHFVADACEFRGERFEQVHKVLFPADESAGDFV